MAKLLVLTQVLLFPKGDKTLINPYLRHSEIDCRCNRSICTFTILNPVVGDRFYMVRSLFGKPLRISSAFRCQSHNHDVSTVGSTSSHTTGNAIDVLTSEFSSEEKSKLEKLLAMHFDYIQVKRDFIHAHINPK